MKRSWKKLLFNALNSVDYAAGIPKNKSYVLPLYLRRGVDVLTNCISSSVEFRSYVKLFGGLTLDGSNHATMTLRQHY